MLANNFGNIQILMNSVLFCDASLSTFFINHIPLENCYQDCAGIFFTGDLTWPSGQWISIHSIFCWLKTFMKGHKASAEMQVWPMKLSQKALNHFKENLGVLQLKVPHVKHIRQFLPISRTFDLWFTNPYSD